MKRIHLAFAISALFALTATSANARPGFRIGLTDDPDTVTVGGFYEAPIAWSGSGFFAIEPGFDLGIGDDVDFFTLRGTVNAKYLIGLDRGIFLYPILGVSIYYVNVDCPGDCDDTSAGLNLGIGFRIKSFNFELSAGINDLPDVTFTVGFLF